ncbi:MAG: ArsR/SmtB family transcription factor [Anaerolineaceae bacterium]|jgi:DNA-binding transcriptional ArsR family regulator
MLPSRRTKFYWDFGSGYDLFLSLRALTEPDVYGLRASWAAGVLGRLPAEYRKTLETGCLVLGNPFYFVHHLSKPKTAEVVLQTLADMPAGQRMVALTRHGKQPKQFRETLRMTVPTKRWTKAEKDLITGTYLSLEKEVTSTFLDKLYQAWAHRESFGDIYLKALNAYYEDFFAAEEQRILPYLRQGLSHAQMRSGSLPLGAMIEELSSGVRYADLESITGLHLAPSFWGAPFLHYEPLDGNEMLMLFGARPETLPLIPGDIVPDTLLLGLKALSDSTRLRILRFLAQSPQTATQLSRALRLRPPTVAHHLRELRIAGVVQVIVDPDSETQYATRFDGFETVQDLLTHFVHGD